MANAFKSLDAWPRGMHITREVFLLENGAGPPDLGNV